MTSNTPLEKLVQFFFFLLWTDVIFRNPTWSREYRTHQSILSCRSRVFKCLLTNGFFSESLQPCPKKIDIVDVTEPAIRALLIHIYTGDFPKNMDEESMWDMVYAADKYELEDLLDYCSAVFIKNSMGNGMWETAIRASRHNFTQLLAVTNQYLARNPPVNPERFSHGATDDILRILRLVRSNKFTTEFVTL